MTTVQQQRLQLIRNVLATAAVHGLPVQLATFLATPVRVHHHETDLPVYVQVRDVTRDTVRCQ